MMGAVVRASPAVLALALVPASAGAGAARPPIALTATPAHVALAGNARTTIRVTNSGTKRALVDVARAGFTLDLRGRPRIGRTGAARSAATWLRLRPTRLAIGPQASASLVVAAKLPRRAEPGDHDALVLLSTHRLTKARVAVRLRLGVVVVVRAPGKVVRRLELRAIRVVRHGKRRALDVVVANRGNVTETVEHARVVVARARNGRRVTMLVAPSRDLRPRTHGVLEFRIRRAARGPMTVRVVIPGAPGRGAVRRTYRVRL